MNRKTTLSPFTLLTALLLPATSHALCVKAEQVNLRSGPGTEYAKSWGVPRYMPFKKIGEQGDWTHVEDMDGDQHWIHNTLISTDMQCAAVTAKSVNVRLGPGTDQEKDELSPVDKYHTFKVNGFEGDWVNVSDENFEDVWVAKPLLWVQ